LVPEQNITVFYFICKPFFQKVKYFANIRFLWKIILNNVLFLRYKDTKQTLVPFSAARAFNGSRMAAHRHRRIGRQRQRENIDTIVFYTDGPL